MLKSWLHDCGTDSEHLHLTLPSPSSGSATPIVLKCDLQERMIHPSLLPSSFTGNFVSTRLAVYPRGHHKCNSVALRDKSSSHLDKHILYNY